VLGLSLGIVTALLGSTLGLYWFASQPMAARRNRAFCSLPVVRGTDGEVGVLCGGGVLHGVWVLSRLLWAVVRRGRRRRS
jgi:hypothetical protein